MIKVTATKVTDAIEGRGAVEIRRVYTENDGLECRQIRTVYTESDYPGSDTYRLSPDNGRTWGDWHVVEKESFSTIYGQDERIARPTDYVWNPIHGHFVATGFSRYFIGGHEEAYRQFWGHGAQSFYDHQSIRIRLPGETQDLSEHLIMYESGKEFDAENPRDAEHLEKNIGFLNIPIVLKNGDIAVPVSATVEYGCRVAGLDVGKVFPSRPKICRCVIVARGRYNAEEQKYEFAFSNPVILSDLRSSRGIDEPILTELESGRLLLIMRGSNMVRAQWDTRIDPGAPSFKWYSYSDDGGAYFTTAEPWHFNDREVIYSSATISVIQRSSKNGKLYWFGNITDHTANANWPRYPLYVAQIDDTSGLLMKETLTLIDTRREGETERIQLSNFHIMEDRETLNFELTLVKCGQYDAKKNKLAEGWMYEIDVEAKSKGE